VLGYLGTQSTRIAHKLLCPAQPDQRCPASHYYLSDWRKSCNICKMGLLNATYVLVALLVSLVNTQSTILAEQVLSSFIYTVYGDRTPLILPQEPTLTPLGAQQLYNAGQTFRNRYIGTNGSDTLGTAILGISPYILDNEAISILTTSDQHLVASASAFMQGLYPPLELSTGITFTTDISILANGSTVTAPLSNYRTLVSLNALPSSGVLYLDIRLPSARKADAARLHEARQSSVQPANREAQNMHSCTRQVLWISTRSGSMACIIALPTQPPPTNTGTVRTTSRC
jgi:hypothetical protein